MFLTTGPAVRRFVSVSLAVSLLSGLALNFSTSVVARDGLSLRQPSRIVFDNIRPSVGPNRSIAVRATVLDAYGREMQEARVIWSIVEDWRHLVSIDPAYGASHTVTITGHRDSETRDAFVTLRATTGSVSSSLVVHYTNENQASAFNHYAVQPGSEPNEIELRDKDDKPVDQIDLPVGSKQIVYAKVHDKYGNRINGAVVKWRLAKSQYGKFVLLGSQVNTNATNSLEIAWGAGDPAIKPPSEVHIIVTCGQDGFTVLNVNYKGIAKPNAKIILDPPDLVVRPGEDAKLKVTVTGEKKADITGDVDITSELLSESAKSVINVSEINDDHEITLTGLNGDPDKTSPIITSALIVRAAGASKTVTVTYRRDPIVVFYEVLPAKVVGDLYGRTIKNDYYCMDVTIQNYSGSDLALAALAFDLNGRGPRPNAGYNTVHGSLARRKLSYPRTLVLAAISTAGMLMTGFNPFFHNIAHGKNFSTFIDIISNPLEKGTGLVWPDSYPDELARLEQQDVLHDDKTVPNNQVYKTKVFFPKRALFPNGWPNRDDPENVHWALGNVLVYGYKFERGPLRQLTTH